MCEVLHGQQGHIYVCGDVRMARDVAAALRALLARGLRLSPEQAEEYFQQLKVALPTSPSLQRVGHGGCAARPSSCVGTGTKPWAPRDCQHSFWSLRVTQEGLCCSAGARGVLGIRVLGTSGA